jgi:hypothetical protein
MTFERCSGVQDRPLLAKGISTNKEGGYIRFEVEFRVPISPRQGDRIEEPHEAHDVLAEALARRSRSIGGDDLHIPGNVVKRIFAR